MFIVRCKFLMRLRENYDIVAKSGNDLDRDSELLELSTANVHIDFEVLYNFLFKSRIKK